MKLSELANKVLGLEARATSADQSLRADVTALRTLLDGQLAQTSSDLATAQASIASLGSTKLDLESKVSELTAKLSEANKDSLTLAESLRGHLATLDEAYAAGGAKANASLSDLISAEIAATNTAMSKTGLNASKLPSAPAAGGLQTTNPKKFATLDEEIAAKKTAAKV